jgi:hypothetical protein
MACSCGSSPKPTCGCGSTNVGGQEFGVGTSLAIAGGVSVIALLLAWLLSGEAAGVELGTDAAIRRR